MEAIITREQFAKLLPTVCDRETSLDPDNWTPENPLWGNCAVVTLVAQGLFGGELRRASLEGHPKWAHMRSHYWNRFPDGSEEDFTEGQFQGDPPRDLESIERTRAYALGNLKTLERYKLLSWRVAKALSEPNALFSDDIFRRCYMNALDSGCQKMRFGCVVVRHGLFAREILGEGSNATIEPMRKLCEPKCIRFGIQSRTESMIGACAHAEETAMWQVIHAGHKVEEATLYIVGVHTNGMPWLKKEAMHSCLRCAVQMHHAKLQQVVVPVGDHWAAITTEQAIRTATDYARKLKSV